MTNETKLKLFGLTGILFIGVIVFFGIDRTPPTFTIDPANAPIIEDELGAELIVEEKVLGDRKIKKAEAYSGTDVKGHVKKAILDGEQPNVVIDQTNWNDIVNAYSEILTDYDLDVDVLERGVYLEIRTKAKERGEAVKPIKYD